MLPEEYASTAWQRLAIIIFCNAFFELSDYE
jgi:hypothetical protein